MKAIIVRTHSAGVHFGYLVNRNGKEVTLTKSRRIWYWEGAFSLSEIATNGLDAVNSKIACPVDIILPEAIEIIDCSDKAMASIESTPNA